MSHIFKWSLFGLLAIGCGVCPAQLVVIDAFKDGGYFDVGQDNNLGGWTHVAVGEANNTRTNRAVFEFDIAGNVPAGAEILDATFRFEVTQQGGSQGQSADDFLIHRILRSWDEGSGMENIGEATGDGATWINATGSELWTTPGGDFDPTVVGSVFVDGAATYDISTPQLVSDLQDIVDGTTVDFGFLMRSLNENDEAFAGSAARVTTREGGNAAKLIICYRFGKVLRGDVNLDGAITLLDVAPFVERLISGTFQSEADVNEDCVVSLLDVDPFVLLLSGG